jgi:hypothetical protein
MVAIGAQTESQLLSCAWGIDAANARNIEKCYEDVHGLDRDVCVDSYEVWIRQ